MKIFFLKLALFLFTAFMLLNFLVAPLIIKSSFKFSFLPWSYIYQKYLKASENHNFKKLIFGDSVASQLFPDKEYENSFTTNGAVLFAGNYIMIKEYLANNQKPSEIVFVMTPYSFRKEFYNVLTFSSFCKPFVTFSNNKLLTEALKGKFEVDFRYYLNYFPAYKVLSCVNDPKVVSVKKETSRFISDINFEYLKKIKELVVLNGIDLKFISPQLSNKQFGDTLDLSKLESEIRQLEMEEYFKYYFNSIQFEDSTSFSDGLHFSRSYIKQKGPLERKRILDFLN